MSAGARARSSAWLRPTVALLALALAGARGSGAQSTDAVQACEAAVRAMLGAASVVRTGGRVERLSAAGGTIAWETPEGHRGSCSTDGAGRLFSVRIERFAPGNLPAGWDAYPVTCESRDGRRRECAIRAPSSVELEESLGGAECVPGSTWGASGTTLWVEGGCRAVFRISPVAAWPPYTLSCDSEEGRRRECEIRAGGRVRLLHRNSRAECVQGRSWDYHGTLLWVDRGCRAVFEVTAGGSWGSDYDRGRDVCLEQARQEGLALVREVGSSQAGRFYEFEMDLDRGGTPLAAVCRYDMASGVARWSER